MHDAKLFTLAVLQDKIAGMDVGVSGGDSIFLGMCRVAMPFSQLLPTCRDAVF